MSVIDLSVQFKTITCCECGCVFAVEASHERSLRRDGSTFYCPSGHRQHFTDTDRKKMERLERNAEWERERRVEAEHQRNHQANRARSLKGQITKVKKRVGNGVCPCCNRTFANLARHMGTQHPDYRDAGGAK